MQWNAQIDKTMIRVIYWIRHQSQGPSYNQPVDAPDLYPHYWPNLGISQWDQFRVKCV